MFRHVLILASLLTFLPTWTGAQPSGPPEDQESEAVLRALSAGPKLRTEALQILAEQRAKLPYSGLELKLFKVVDKATGRGYRIALDASNERVDYDESLRREQAARFERFGHMHPELHRLVEIGEQATIPVLIRVAVGEEERLDKSELESPTAFRDAGSRAQELDDAVARHAAEVFAATVGGQTLRAEAPAVQSGPFFSVELPLGAIRELARDDRVAFIGLDRERVVLDYPTIPASLPTTATDTVHSSGYKGSGIKIAVLESGGLTLPGACFHVAETQNAGAAADFHLTRSVGIIGNRYSGGGCSGSWQGYAPEASILLANNNSYTTAYEWAKARTANIVTMSWHYPSEETSGALHSRDEYFDYWVTRYPYPTIFASAGNQAPNAYSSGKGYNFFGVANVLNDGDGNRCNDAISTDSSWKDPTSPHGDREVPEIASPGSRHAMLGSSFGGTSAATPVTAAIAALLMERNSSLKIWPETIRAILLATANYQDADGANWSKSSDGRDGTGLTNSKYAMWTAGKRETGTTAQYRAHDYGSMSSASFSGGFFNKTWKAKTGTTSSRIRVAVTWNSKASSTTSSVLDADLDLRVYDSSNNLVASSTSWDSNYEFVEFSPSASGEYTIKIRGYSVPADFWSYYAVAWTTHYDLCP